MSGMRLPSPPPIYLDHHATTPVDPRVASSVLEVMTASFGNANSVENLYGEIAADLVSHARSEVASLIGGEANGVNFTSGATEAIDLAMAHAVTTIKNRPLRVALSSVEHRAVLDAVSLYQGTEDLEVYDIPVDRHARLDIAGLERVCNHGVDLVCVMAANNEVGTIYPIEEIAELANRSGALSLIDATQAAGRIPIEVYQWRLDYVVLSAHKIYGPKGVGALVVPSDVEVRPKNEAAPGTGTGTANVPGIVGLGKACQLRRLEMDEDEPRIAAQRDRLEQFLLANVAGLVVNGDRSNRLSNNLHVSVPGAPNDLVVSKLRHTVALSTGAACSSGAESHSHVLRAMSLSDELLDGALRIGTGKFTSDDDIETAGVHISRAITSAREALRG